MTPEPLTVLYLALLVIGIFWMTFGYSLSRSKHRRQVRPPAQSDGYAGKFLKDYQPRTTIHSVVNTLFARSTSAPINTAVLAVEEFSDVSFWQGEIDWVKMATKARKVIIRAGQNTWTDVRFILNYSEAKRVGMLRGCYWFHDGRASPGAQARLLVSLIRDDPPELGVWIDYEHNYGGAWEGLGNVVAMMQEVERLLPDVEVNFYTGFWWMVENTNPILHRSQYAYLAKRKLWLAWYGPTPRIPAPWTKMHYHQFGTPAVGIEWGVSSFELDMNTDMSGDPQPEPPTGEPMETTQYRYTHVPLTTERVAPSVTATPTGRTYPPGSVVDVEEIVSILNDKWFKLGVGRFAAYIYNGTTRAELVAAPVPVPSPDDGVKVSIDLDLIADFNGKQYRASIQLVNVQMVEV